MVGGGVGSPSRHAPDFDLRSDLSGARVPGVSGQVPVVVVLIVCIVGIVLLTLNVGLVLLFVHRRRKRTESEFGPVPDGRRRCAFRCDGGASCPPDAPAGRTWCQGTCVFPFRGQELGFSAGGTRAVICQCMV